MKRIKLAVIITILCIAFTMIAPKSYAADESFELQLEASSTTLNPGDSFSVDIIIDNMNVTSGDQGIGAYQAKIIYDTNVLELVNVTAATGWEVLENEGNMVANTSNAEVVTERTHTATINFKVLDNVTFGDTTISLESVQGSSGTTTIDGTGIAEVVSIEEESTNPPIDDNDPTDDDNPPIDDNNPSDDDNPPIDDNNPSDDNNNPSIDDDNPSDNIGGNDNTQGGSTTNRNQIGTSSNMNQSTTSNRVLPYAGIRNAIIIAIGVSIVAAVVFFIKYRRAV